MAPERVASLLRRTTSSTHRKSPPLRTPSPLPSKTCSCDGGLIVLRYEEAIAAKPPVTVAPPQRAAPLDLHPALRTNNERKRDSGLAVTTSSKARESSINTVEENVLEFAGIFIDFNINSTDNMAQTMGAQPTVATVAHDEIPISPISTTTSKTEKSAAASGHFWRKSSSKNGSKKSLPTSNTPPATEASEREEFSPITTPIPTDSLVDDEFINMTFSKRGSVMLGGEKPVGGHLRTIGGRRQPSISMLATPTVKELPKEVEMESQKVRSMYEQQTNFDWREGRFSPVSDLPANEERAGSTQSNGLLTGNIQAHYQRPDSDLSSRSDRLEHERAGGIEDWEDINERDVDRYGFINKHRLSRPGTPEPRPPQRISTVLMVASESPRKKRLGRSPSTITSKRGPNRQISTRSLKTQNSTNSGRSNSRAQLRAAANRLPGNRDRRWMEEAGDMLTLPPGLADIAEDEEGGKVTDFLKKKEFERFEKWRKMAKVVKTGKDGEGMEFEFDARNAKLIERSWKGIPDRWRASAWHSFLTTSAKKRKGYVPDEEIKTAFYKLQKQSSADDVQIDIDVPRTINSHIMFRKRYRGGQRLLFRVLHALSLYFPETGYVQGMASLAATLLCYYDEEMAFVMLTRMWTLRGLQKLYEPGFSGLMSALDEFQKSWLKGREVSRKLDDLCIEPTAYGTRWYLTLFNYSIPFPAQLRVWDVFMLLGDCDPSLKATEERPFAGGLDILHATSAALIDGTREILLDSDFENAMKVLTSWIPVKDEDLLMKVAKAEWKMMRKKHRRRAVISTPKFWWEDGSDTV